MTREPAASTEGSHSGSRFKGTSGWTLSDEAPELADPPLKPTFTALKPVVEAPTDDPRALHRLKDRDQDYLTQDDLIEAHGRTGALMHSANPFGQPIDYPFFQQNFLVWRAKIINLLNNHQVFLLNDIGSYLFHLKETRDDEVHWYRFEPASQP